MGLGKKTADSPVAAAAKEAVIAGAAVAEMEKEAGAVDQEAVIAGAAVDQDIAEVNEVEPEVAPAKEKAVATKSQAAAPAVRSAFVGVALSGLKDVIPVLDFGTLPRFKATPAGIKGEDGPLGQWCEGVIVSYNDQFAVSPCADSAPKEYCKFSMDGVTLADGSGTVADHIKMLKEEGYDKAACKRYNDLILILEDSEKEHEELGNMVTFSLSPMSVKAFERYQLQTTVKIGMGVVTEEAAKKIRISAKDGSFGSKDFKYFTFSMATGK